MTPYGDTDPDQVTKPLPEPMLTSHQREFVALARPRLISQEVFKLSINKMCLEMRL